MPIGKDQFDADLQALVSANTDYIAAVDAFIALPPVIDLANEDASVQAALTAINEARSRIPTPPTPNP